jgi:hypothetical protein
MRENMMDEWMRNGMRNPMRTWRRIKVSTMMVVAFWMDAMISKEQRTVVKVEVPVTPPVALMDELKSINSNQI